MSDVARVQAPNQVQAMTEETSDFWTSLRLTSRADKIAMIQKINSSTPLLDKVGETILLKDVILQQVQFTNEETSLVEDTVRTTIIDPDGNAYHAASKGIAISLRTTFKVLGNPDTWDEPLEVKVREGRVGKNRYLTLDY